MRIEVKLFATLRLALGRGSVTLDFEAPPRVSDLIDAVSREVGEDIRPWLMSEDGNTLMGTMILLGGKNIHHLEGLDTPVTVDTVSIFPPAGGG
ncbi:MAG: MoaD/ThiS family protein [Alkalispirochaeta sp.]